MIGGAPDIVAFRGWFDARCLAKLNGGIIPRTTHDTMPNVFDLVCEQNGWAVIDGAAVVPLPGDRQQSLYQDTSDDSGDEVLRVYSIIGGAEELQEVQLRAALSINSRLLYGALGIMGDNLVLADTFLLHHADANEVDRSVQYVAKTADEYERLIYKTDSN